MHLKLDHNDKKLLIDERNAMVMCDARAAFVDDETRDENEFEVESLAACPHFCRREFLVFT